MAVYYGGFPYLMSGAMVAEFDEQIVKNSNWSIHDTNPVPADTTDIVVNGNFASGDTGWSVGAGWSTASGKAVHTAGGGVAILRQSSLGVGSQAYTVTFTISNSTSVANALIFTMGSTEPANRQIQCGVNGTYTLEISSLSVFEMRFVPITGFDGSVDDISIVKVTTAARVYKCSTVGSVFYLYMDNNRFSYSIVRVWESWDAGTHTGSGTHSDSVIENTFPIQSTSIWTGISYVFIINDTRFIYITSNMACYVGRLKLFDENINGIALIALSVGLSTSYNALGHGSTRSSSGPIWLYIDLTNHVVRYLLCPGTDTTAGIIYAYPRTARGWIVQESLVYSSTELKLLGTLDGVMSVGDITVLSNRTVLVNGVPWMISKSTGGSFVRLD